MITAAKVVKHARTKAGITQDVFNVKAGYCNVATSRIERNAYEPSFCTVVNMVEACGFKLEDVIVELREGEPPCSA